MSPTLRAWVLVMALSLAAIVVAFYLTRCTVGPTERVPAPAFFLRTLDGTDLTLQALHGKVVLVDFWATWCGPCRDEVPDLIALQREYGPRGVQLVGISLDDSETPVREFYDELGMNYPVGVAEVALAEQFGGVLGLPVKFLIDREGRIANRYDGGVTKSTLAKELSTLLDQ